MSELTDLEICKRIAEIEGFEFCDETCEGNFYQDRNTRKINLNYRRNTHDRKRSMVASRLDT